MTEAKRYVLFVMIFAASYIMSGIVHSYIDSWREKEKLAEIRKQEKEKQKKTYKLKKRTFGVAEKMRKKCMNKYGILGKTVSLYSITCTFPTLEDVYYYDSNTGLLKFIFGNKLLCECLAFDVNDVPIKTLIWEQ